MIFQEFNLIHIVTASCMKSVLFHFEHNHMMVFQLKNIAKITLEYSIFTNKSTTRMNIESFQIPCLFHPTLWIWCTFVCDFSEFQSVFIWILCKRYTNVSRWMCTFDLAICCNEVERLYKTYFLFIKLFLTIKNAHNQMWREEEKKAVRIGLQTISSTWTWNWRQKDISQSCLSSNCIDKRC